MAGTVYGWRAFSLQKKDRGVYASFARCGFKGVDCLAL
jgi:hypothetical protein